LSWFDIGRWEISTGPPGKLTNPEYDMKIVNNGGVLSYIWSRYLLMYIIIYEMDADYAN